MNKKMNKMSLGVLIGISMGMIFGCTTPHPYLFLAPEMDLTNYVQTSCENVTGNESGIDSTMLISFVDPFLGTAGHGHTFPGPVVPFGMVQVSPDNGITGWDWCSGYHWYGKSIDVISHKHLSGTGVGDLGDIGIMPSLDGRQQNSPFSHDNEYAHPGYYAVKLDNGILIELTASKRAALHRYTFPEDADQIVRIDLQHKVGSGMNLKTRMKQVNSNTIVGLKRSSGWAPKQDVWFAMVFDRPIKEAKLGMGLGTLAFDTTKPQLGVKVALSSVSSENALENLDTEVAEKNFSQVKKDAELFWEDELSKIKITTNDVEDTKVFYGSLYHVFIAPALFSDVNGEYLEPDGTITTCDGYDRYSTLSLWDTYRATHPLFVLTQRDLTNDFVKSMLAHYDVRGFLPIWELEASENYCMIGNHSVSVIVDAWLKGIRDYDVEKAYKACRETLMLQDFRAHDLYRELGYVPCDVEKESVSQTLENGYNDWCMALFAKGMGEEADYELFSKRALNYQNLFDEETKLMRPRQKNGKFLADFDPYAHQQGLYRHYTEGNAWQHSWGVQHDVAGLIELYGGEEPFLEVFNQLFELPDDAAGSGSIELVDVTGLIGQYAQGNEPSHHVAYMYNWTKESWKAQKLVNQIFNEFYHSRPDGIIGNEDCGQMSAWYVFNAMGFYPVDPASGEYQFGSPRLASAEIQVGDGKTFKMFAENAGRDTPYIQSVTINGEAIDRTYITYDEIMSGSELRFVMGSQPKK